MSDVDGSASGKTGKGKEAAGSASNGKSKKDYIEKAQKAYKDAQKAVKTATGAHTEDIWTNFRVIWINCRNNYGVLTPE